MWGVELRPRPVRDPLVAQRHRPQNRSRAVLSTFNHVRCVGAKQDGDDHSDRPKTVLMLLLGSRD